MRVSPSDQYHLQVSPFQITRRKKSTPFPFVIIIAICLGTSSLLLQHVQATNDAGLQWLAKQREDKHTVETPSGLMYKRKIKKPRGTHHPSFDAYCKIQLEISRVLDHNGTTELVESTTAEGGGQPITLRPEDSSLPVIREALQSMVEGDWWELYVPSHLGYQHGDNKNNKNKATTTNHDDNNDAAALLVELELQEISHGDLLPAGEVHRCFFQIQWNAAERIYFFQPNSECDERDQTYIQKVSRWDSRSSKADAETARLRNMLAKENVKQELGFWMRRRMHILKQFLKEEMRICTLIQDGAYMEDCNAQEQEYVKKVDAWEDTKVAEEIERLVHMDQTTTTSLEPTLASWVRRRIRILNQMQSVKSKRHSVDNNNNNSDNNTADDTGNQETHHQHEEL
ncbi:expressed unknown protein [Seminavis robusta]|uniref:Uncharacterized protein n=1 Tax=Seminavis robusta TaxID=568900 RepID=A0A9N8DXP7_9STRA|nr:expressed unknown protein [Seminavis robusta]|eukprot:Sro351_g123900.1 n/a (399) ;mRNA; f:26028-27224